MRRREISFIYAIGFTAWNEALWEDETETKIHKGKRFVALISAH